jgi:hypothetical protein
VLGYAWGVVSVFDDPAQLLAYAKERIGDLEREIDRFFKSEPYARVVEPDADGAYEEHKIRFTKRIPNSVINIAAGVINDLRAVLDHAGYAAATTSGKINPRHAYFPFGTDADFERSTKGRSKNVPPEIVSLMRSFKPYRTGNDLLWAVNEACCTNKHALLTPVAILPGGVRFKNMNIPSTTGFYFPRPVWDSAKNEIVFLAVRPGTQYDYNVNLGFDITFNKVDVIKGQPLIRVLNAMASEVERILMAIEAETRRLFPASF